MDVKGETSHRMESASAASSKESHIATLKLMTVFVETIKAKSGLHVRSGLRVIAVS